MSSPTYLHTGTNGTLTVEGLILLPDGTPIIGATVTGTLRDASGNIVSNWNAVSMTDQGGGTYTYDYTGANVPVVGTYIFTMSAVSAGKNLSGKKTVLVKDLIL